MEHNGGIGALQTIPHQPKDQRRDQDGQRPQGRMGEPMSGHEEDRRGAVRQRDFMKRSPAPRTSSELPLNQSSENELFNERQPENGR